jgi:hypothetical protein
LSERRGGYWRRKGCRRRGSKGSDAVEAAARLEVAMDEVTGDLLV